MNIDILDDEFEVSNYINNKNYESKNSGLFPQKKIDG